MASQLDNPKSWTTGSDAPTEKQTSFLQTLAKEKGVEVDANNLNKGDASAKINELKKHGLLRTQRPLRGNRFKIRRGGRRVMNPATGKQTGYIAVMAKEAGEEVKTQGMGKTEASERSKS